VETEGIIGAGWMRQWCAISGMVERNEGVGA